MFKQIDSFDSNILYLNCPIKFKRQHESKYTYGLIRWCDYDRFGVIWVCKYNDYASEIFTLNEVKNKQVDIILLDDK